jgi:hypothetical protein
MKAANPLDAAAVAPLPLDKARMFLQVTISRVFESCKKIIWKE